MFPALAGGSYPLNHQVSPISSIFERSCLRGVKGSAQEHSWLAAEQSPSDPKFDTLSITLGCKVCLEKAMAPHSSTLAWKIPWTEEPGRLQSMGSQRVGHDWATSLSLFTFLHWRRKWQPTPVFLPGESQGRGSLVGCRLWGRTDWSNLAAAAKCVRASSCKRQKVCWNQLKQKDNLLAHVTSELIQMSHRL